MGKTTLARAVTQSLPTPVHWVAGTESARSIPLGVFAHLVGPAASRDPIAGLVAARETIHSAKHSIIGVDDAHLLDHLSATLVHQLALERSVRIVAAVRDGEPVPDAITSLWKDWPTSNGSGLHRSARGSAWRWWRKALGGRLEGLSGDLMWTASCGNALYIRHLVEGAVEAGTLRQVRGVWQLRGRTAVTSESASLLDARIEQLPVDEAHTLQLLAFAEPLSLHCPVDAGRGGHRRRRRAARIDPRRGGRSWIGRPFHPSPLRRSDSPWPRPCRHPPPQGRIVLRDAATAGSPTRTTHSAGRIGARQRLRPPTPSFSPPPRRTRSR